MRPHGVLFVAVSLVASMIAASPLPAAADLDPVGLCDPSTPGAIVGTAGDDVLVGTSGPDVIIGLGGDDELRGMGGADILCGGDGDDVLMGNRGADQLLGEAGNDILRGGKGKDTLDGGPGDDKLWGNQKADLLYGGAGNDLIRGNKGKDSVDGGPGDDDLRGGRGDDLLVGGAGVDRIDGGPGIDACGGETVSACESETGPEAPADDGYCTYDIYPDDGDVQVLLDPDVWLGPGQSTRILRSTNGGDFTEVAVLDDATLYYLDSPIPVGEARYVAETLADTGEVLSSHECNGGVAAPSQFPSYEDLGVPTVASGVPGLAATGTPPVPVMMDPPPSPSLSPGPDTARVCTAGLVRSIPGPTTWAKIYVPANTKLVFDIQNTKTTRSNGNWSGTFRMYEVNADGTKGPYAGGAGSDITNYYWTSLSQPKPNGGHFKNTGAGREFFITFELVTSVSVSSSEGARVSIGNVRYLDANGEIVATPCVPAEILKCTEAGGTAYFADAVEVNGVVYTKGCYELDTCVPTHASVLGWVQEWACENDSFLELALIAAVTVVVLAGGFIVISAVVAGGTALFVGEAGAAALDVYAGMSLFTLAVLLTMLVVTYQETELVFSDGMSLPIAVPTYDFDGWTSDELTALAASLDELAIALGVSVSEVPNLLFEQANVPQPSDLDPIAEELLGQAVKYGLMYCASSILVSASETFLEELASEFGLAPIVDAKDLILPDGKHLCTQIPTISSGSVHHTTGKPVWQATWHMDEIVYGASPYSPEPLHDGEDPALVANGNTPKPSRIFLHAWPGRPADPEPWNPWYFKPPYQCEGKELDVEGIKVNQCDEYPWRATKEGGPPAVPDRAVMPHLRLIDGSQNGSSGTELKAFFKACELSEGDLFLSLPMPMERMLVPGISQPIPVPTVFFGNSC